MYIYLLKVYKSIDVVYRKWTDRRRHFYVIWNKIKNEILFQLEFILNFIVSFSLVIFTLRPTFWWQITLFGQYIDFVRNSVRYFCTVYFWIGITDYKVWTYAHCVFDIVLKIKQSQLLVIKVNLLVPEHLLLTYISHPFPNARICGSEFTSLPHTGSYWSVHDMSQEPRRLGLRACAKPGKRIKHSFTRIFNTQICLTVPIITEFQMRSSWVNDYQRGGVTCLERYRYF